MQQKILGFLKIFIPFFIICLLIQFALVNYLFQPELYYSTFAIYAFQFIATLIVYFLLVLVQQNFSDKTGFAFMGCGLFKMLAAVLFLLPMMLNGTLNPFQSLIAFFIPYFIFLVFETIYAVKLINLK